MIKWRHIPQLSNASLHILSKQEMDRGFIYKPADTKTDKNAWRLHLGIGEGNKFVCHVFGNKDKAKQVLEKYV